ncbi:M14 family metallopeptidase [Pseudofulvibacter geojedonensis]|uniref:M14 metallopeptidase family protein n=1 Tax=Pseudofulvibacter geojedonensis TaxID=1123758 RepID=A0ABW3HY55_9FLAO
MRVYTDIKEESLFGRYINNNDVEKLINKYKSSFKITHIGTSVKKRKIYSFNIGVGNKRILVWSQMHGNESTTTKALFDFFNYLMLSNENVDKLLRSYTFCFIPILNPDGAEYYTRFNANQVDLNRDAQKLSQPESKVLRKVYDSFKPHFCFNLHGQRTIFSAGYSNNSSVLSFLSPASDMQRSITSSRKIGMEVISVINKELEKELPNQIARYDDAFNINCVGDTFQSLGTPTILFEAGHYPGDYKREKTRYFIFKALKIAFDYIVSTSVKGDYYQAYFKLPENQKLFYDVIIRDVKGCNENSLDVAIQYKEELVDGEVNFIPLVEKVGDLTENFAHKELNANFKKMTVNGKEISADSLGIINEILLDGEDFVKKVIII